MKVNKSIDVEKEIWNQFKALCASKGQTIINGLSEAMVDYLQKHGQLKFERTK